MLVLVQAEVAAENEQVGEDAVDAVERVLDATGMVARLRDRPRRIGGLIGVPDQVGVQPDDAELLEHLMRHHRRHLPDRREAFAVLELPVERLETAVLLLDHQPPLVGPLPSYRRHEVGERPVSGVMTTSGPNGCYLLETVETITTPFGVAPRCTGVSKTTGKRCGKAARQDAKTCAIHGPAGSGYWSRDGCREDPRLFATAGGAYRSPPQKS